MAKFQSPLLGYNNNVRHRGRVFHIQTEDSGVTHPHVITHLFMDGGRILKSVKRSYSEHVGQDKMSDTVRALMKEQHKAMVVALRDGEFDELVGSGTTRPAGASVAPAPRKTPVAGPAPPHAPAPGPKPVVVAEEFAPSTINERSHTAPLYVEPPLPPELAALLRDELAPGPDPDPADIEPPTTREPSPPEHPQELTLDFDALERDAGPTPGTFRTDLPPPPQSMFPRERTQGGYRAVDVAPEQAMNRPSARTSRSERPAPRPPSAPPRAQQAQPKKRAASVFGDAAANEKSLDEVILSYLAEDLDPAKK